MYEFPINLIVVDIDRTTLTDDYRILPDVVDAVGRARRTGVLLAAATARSPAALQPIAAALGIDGLCVCLNGAWTGLIFEPEGGVFQQAEMERGNAIKAIRQAHALGLNPCWFTASNWHALADGPLVAREVRATGTQPTIVPSLEDFEAPILKLLCLEDPPKDAMCNAIRKAHEGHFDFTRSDTHLIEITRKGVSKKSAIRRLADHLGVHRSNIAAIGDSENDLDMIRWSGLGIAVGNAQTAVLQAADWTTETNANAGVAHAIERIIASNLVVRNPRMV